MGWFGVDRAGTHRVRQPHDRRPSPAHPVEIAGDHQPGAHPHHRFAPGTDAGGNRAFPAIRVRLAARHFRSRHKRFGDAQQLRRLPDGLHDRRNHADHQLGGLQFADRHAVWRHRAGGVLVARRPARHFGLQILRRSVADRLESCRRGQPGNCRGRQRRGQRD